MCLLRSSRFRVVEGRGRLSPASDRTDRDGIASVSFTPRSAGAQGIIEVEAYTGDLSPVIFTINVGEPPDAINKISGDDQSGRPGTALANPFVVEVVDENGDGVSGATVAFRSLLAVVASRRQVRPQTQVDAPRQLSHLAMQSVITRLPHALRVSLA